MVFCDKYNHNYSQKQSTMQGAMHSVLLFFGVVPMCMKLNNFILIIYFFNLF